MNTINKGDLPKSGGDQVIEIKEKNNSGTYYLDNLTVRQVIAEKWPDNPIETLAKIVKPIISDNPDELETWEASQRTQRNFTLEQRSVSNPLQLLQHRLYEECFGVNATPGINESFHDSLAPTPGGIISHGYAWGSTDGYTLESVAKLNFKGDDGRSAVDSLESSSERRGMATILANILSPIELGSSPEAYSADRINKQIQLQLLKPGLQPAEEVTTWALRLVKLIKEHPEFNNPIQDPELKNILGIKEGVEVSLIRYWAMLWSRMDKAFLNQSDTGVVTYKNVENVNVQNVIGQLLKIRIHPETQILFKYLSPSGYLNEKNGE